MSSIDNSYTVLVDCANCGNDHTFVKIPRGVDVHTFFHGVGAQPESLPVCEFCGCPTLMSSTARVGIRTL